MTAVRARFCLFPLYSSICLSALHMYVHAFAWVTLISMQFTWFVTNIDNTVYYGTYFNNITLHIAYFLVMGYFLLLHALPRYIWSVTTGGYCQSRHISYSNKAGQPRIFWSLRPTLCQTLPNVCFFYQNQNAWDLQRKYKVLKIKSLVYQCQRTASQIVSFATKVIFNL